MPDYEVILKSVESIHSVVTIRDTIPAYPAIGQLFNEIMAYLDQNQVKAQDYWVTSQVPHHL